MSALQDVEWEAPLLSRSKNPEALKFVKSELRIVPDAARYYLDSPWITRALVAFDSSKLPIVYVPHSLPDLMALVVSQENSCRYCYAVMRSVLKIMGLSEQRLDALERDLPLAEFAPETRPSLDFARVISRANPLPRAQDAEPLLRAGFSRDAVKEVNFLAAVYLFLNRLTTIPALPFDSAEHMADTWQVRFFRPFIARYLRSRTNRGAKPTPLRPEQRSGPMAPIVNAFDGLPIAGTLRQVVDEAWSSPVLPKRTKAIVLAVIARGLGCCISEGEAVQLLRDEGIPQADVEDVLNHFDAPSLTAKERAIAPFARETIWYRPAQIQRRTRELAALLTREELIDVIGLASLGNLLCRLSASVDLARPTTSPAA